MIKQILSNHLVTITLIILASAFSLGAAFTASSVFDLKPCNLCIYQRYPFAIAIILGLIGLAFYKNKNIATAILGICGINFLTNSGIAFYHTGVEQKWWESILEGCAIDFSTIKDTGKSALESIMGTPLTSCSDIAWQDPIIGLSMANYNIIFCFGLFVFCILSAVMVKKTRDIK